MGGLSPNLTPEGNAPNICRTDGRGRPLDIGRATDAPQSIPGRYDPYNDRFDPEVFDTSMVVALTLASITLVVGIIGAIVAVPITIARRLLRKKSS